MQSLINSISLVTLYIKTHDPISNITCHQPNDMQAGVVSSYPKRSCYFRDIFVITKCREVHVALQARLSPRESSIATKSYDKVLSFNNY
jgi:hypothetical protein